jgi:hypothetical protein
MAAFLLPAFESAYVCVNQRVSGETDQTQDHTRLLRMACLTGNIKNKSVCLLVAGLDAVILPLLLYPHVTELD